MKHAQNQRVPQLLERIAGNGEACCHQHFIRELGIIREEIRIGSKAKQQGKYHQGNTPLTKAEQHP